MPLVIDGRSRSSRQPVRPASAISIPASNLPGLASWHGAQYVGEVAAGSRRNDAAAGWPGGGVSHG
ncbi:hypothetical protein BBJ41_32990 [Burkholderia stabilis]|nr:hypothetical protein BBJ41_32990 [Burkholderia stabilis]